MIQDIKEDCPLNSTITIEFEDKIYYDIYQKKILIDIFNKNNKFNKKPNSYKENKVSLYTNIYYDNINILH